MLFIPFSIVALKTEDQQARAMLFRTRQMFVGQRTQMYLAQIEGLNARVAELDQKMRSAAKAADVARRFQT